MEEEGLRCTWEGVLDPRPILPISRPRWWSLWHKLPLNATGVEKGIHIQRTMDDLLTTTKAAMTQQPLTDFLLADDHPIVSAIAAGRLESFMDKFADAPVMDTETSTLKWLPGLKVLFTRFGCPWVTPVVHPKNRGRCGYSGYAHLEGTCGWYSLLSDRQKHLLILLDFLYPVSASRPLQVADVSQGGSYIFPLRYGVAPCVASKSQFLIRAHRKRARMAVSDEFMMLQGMPSNVAKAGLSENQLVNLAGNAFCTASAMPLIAGLVATFPTDRL